MKKMKKIFALLIAMVMVLGMSTAVFAQTVPLNPADADNATITITNASKGETYKIAKLFDATVSATTDTTTGESTSIAYTGDIPSTMSSYFTKDTAGNISATAALDLSDENVQAVLKTWAEANVTAQAVSDGSELEFTKLPYGYYIITTTQGETLLTVDSTRPSAEVIDKNTTPPIDNPTKTADDDNVFIGQTVTYTVSFGTANYDGTEQITAYKIADNFANGVLTNVQVTGIRVDGVAATTPVKYTDAETALTVPFAWTSGKTISIDWVDENGASAYANGATLEITYTATVAASAQIDGDGNVNTVNLTYTTDEDHPYQIPVTETIYTYAIAIQKVDQAGGPLAGAKFQLPFYVQATADATDGAYIYAGTTAGDGLVNELTTPATGLIIVKGVEAGTYSITETEAPKGYNKLGAPVTVTAVQTGSTTTSSTTYYDADGNEVGQDDPKVDHNVTVTIDDLSATPVVVVNKTGTELPSTGGIGTTIFYIIGAILVIGAGVVLVTRRRMNAN